MRSRQLFAVAPCLILAGVVSLATVTRARAEDHARAVFNVRDFGATGAGTVVDTGAIDAAIAAAAAARADGAPIVEFPPGTYLSVTIHLLSGVTLQLDEGATVVAARTGFDPPEDNPFAKYQDFAHSHFHNSLLVGDGVEDVAIVGSGTLDGRGLGETNSPARGQGDKILALRACRRVHLSGVTFRRGGHIAITMNGCSEVAIDHVRVLTREHRDGIDVVNSSAVTIESSHVVAGDDAIAFKADYALGRIFVSGGNRVLDSTVESRGNNALKIGTETCGDLRDIAFRNVRVTGAGAAGIGIVSLDGGSIESITAERIDMTNVATAVFVQAGDRARCPGSPPPGRIRDVTLRDVSGRGLVAPDGKLESTPTITGMAGHPIEHVTLERVHLVLPGGHSSDDATAVPHEPSTAYVPNTLGVRPAYGWWIRHVRDLAVKDCSVGFERDDGRPALIVGDGDGVVIDRFRFDRGTTSPYDFGLNGVSGYRVTDATSASGDPLRLGVTGSTPAREVL